MQDFPDGLDFTFKVILMKKLLKLFIVLLFFFATGCTKYNIQGNLSLQDSVPMAVESENILIRQEVQATQQTQEVQTTQQTQEVQTTQAKQFSIEYRTPMAKLIKYINNGYAFSLEYPEDWRVVENSKFKYFTIRFLSKETEKWRQETGTASTFDFDIYIIVYDSVANLSGNKTGQLSLKEWITKKTSRPYPGIFDLQEIILANSIAFRAFYGSADAPDPVIFTEHNKKIYSININHTDEDDPRNEQFEKIIQTFKFTD